MREALRLARGRSVCKTLSRFHLHVKVVPGASREGVTGWLGDSLKVRVQAPPEKGKANRAVIKLLADVLDVPRTSIELVQGRTVANKVFAINGMSEQQARSVIERVP